MLLGDFLFSAGLHSCLIPTHLASITALTQSRDTQRQAAHPSGRGSTARTHFAAQSHRSMVSVCGHCRPCTPSELWTSQPDAIFLQAGADSATAPGQAGTPDTPPPIPPTQPLASSCHTNASISPVYLVHLRLSDHNNANTLEKRWVCVWYRLWRFASHHSCAQDPNWKHPSAGSPLIYRRPVLVHQSESAPFHLTLDFTPFFFKTRSTSASQEMMSASLRNYSRGLITQWERGGFRWDLSGLAWWTGLSPRSLSLFPRRCDKLYQLLLLDFKMPRKGVMDFRDQPRRYFVTKPRKHIYHKSVVFNVFAPLQTDYRWWEHSI